MISNYFTWLKESNRSKDLDYITGGEGVYDSRLPEPLRKQLNVFLLIALANDNSHNESMWISLFDNYYESGLTYTYGGLTDELREKYASGDWAYKVLNINGNFQGYNSPLDRSARIEIEKIVKNRFQGWKIEGEEVSDEETLLQAILSKEITDAEKEERSKYLAAWFKKHKSHLNSAQINGLAKLLSPEERYVHRGAISGAKYNI